MSCALHKSMSIAAAFLLGGAAALALPDCAMASAPLFDESRGVLSVASVLEQVTPAVVNIAVLTRVRMEENPLLKDPFFRKLFAATGNQWSAAGAASAVSGLRRHHRHHAWLCHHQPSRREGRLSASP